MASVHLQSFLQPLVRVMHDSSQIYTLIGNKSVFCHFFYCLRFNVEFLFVLILSDTHSCTSLHSQLLAHPHFKSRINEVPKWRLHVLPMRQDQQWVQWTHCLRAKLQTVQICWTSFITQQQNVVLNNFHLKYFYFVPEFCFPTGVTLSCVLPRTAWYSSSIPGCGRRSIQLKNQPSLCCELHWLAVQQSWNIHLSLISF